MKHVFRMFFPDDFFSFCTNHLKQRKFSIKLAITQNAPKSLTVLKALISLKAMKILNTRDNLNILKSLNILNVQNNRKTLNTLKSILNYVLTSLGSMTATFPFPNFETNFAAVEQPPAPPPTTTSLKLKRKKGIRMLIRI